MLKNPEWAPDSPIRSYQRDDLQITCLNIVGVPLRKRKTAIIGLSTYRVNIGMVASRESVIHHKKPDITQMLRLARIAANEGDLVRANQLLKRAALLDPANEQVWLMLLHVVETVEDQRTCLLNILTINPDNEAASKLLVQLEEAALTVEQRHERRQRPLSSRMLDILLWGVEIVVILLLIGLAIVLIAYA